MDPLSITTAVVTLTGVCLTTAKQISDLCKRYHLTLVTLITIQRETTIVSAALGQIQTALLRFTSQFQHNNLLLQTLDTALTGCTMVVLALQEEIEQFEVALCKEQADKNGKLAQPNWITRVKLLWREGVMKELLEQIRGQETSLGILLQALTMQSMAGLNSLIANHSTMLVRISRNTSILRRSYPGIQIPHSIFDASRQDGVSIFSHTALSAGATEFDFDNFLIDSRVYRRAFMGGYLRPRHIMDVSEENLPGETDTIKARLDGGETDSSHNQINLDAIVPVPVPTQISTSDPEKWSVVCHGDVIPSSLVEAEVVTVRTIAGSLVETKAEEVAQWQRKFEELTEKYRKVKKYYFDKDLEVVELTKAKEESDKLHKEKENEILRLLSDKEALSESHKEEEAELSRLKLQKEESDERHREKDDEIFRLLEAREELEQQGNEKDVEIFKQNQEIRKLHLKVFMRDHNIRQLVNGQIPIKLEEQQRIDTYG